VLSFVMSMAVVPLTGLILNYTPWRVRLEPILYSTASFIFIMSVVALFRRARIPEEKRFSIRFQFRMPRWGGGNWDKALSVILVFAILGALGTVGYVIVKPKVGERFTEFYILGMEGKAVDYPKELVVGEEVRVIVGIINHEHETVSYQVAVRIDEVENSEIGPVVLEHNEKWEGEISFVPEVGSENQKVEFLLYKDGETEPYLEPLRLWLNVTESR